MRNPADLLSSVNVSPSMLRPDPSLILWDLVGSCNLRCPSCPMGNMRSSEGKGFMADELFHAILRKLQSDFTCRQLHFYNWTEPLLHPRIGGLCREAADAGFHVHLSSNLNYLKDAEGILASGIKTFRISLSGFTQDTYRVGHRGGDIEKVKANMRTLADASRITQSRTRIHVYFHKYRHNLHEMAAMEAFSRGLGFDFQANWAYLMPLEKVLGYVEAMIGEDERAFVENHIVPPVNEALRLAREAGGCETAAREAGGQRCELIEQLVLDHRGRAMLCCATFDTTVNVIGDYLQLDWSELQRRRYAHAMCGRCTAIGAHTLFTNFAHPVLREKIANAADAAIASGGPERPVSIRLPILHEQRAAILAKSA
jgi:MoaA/NifB/PqqE/SkfB family radical SAM enzyme